MSGPTYNEMEAKRLEMIASFREIAAAMKHCVSVIEDYARLSPHTLNAIDPALLPTTLAAAASTPAPVVGDDGKKVKAKRDKKIKDPNAPKRPPSAYILFQNEVREEIRKKNPEMPYKEVLGIISQMWKDLPETAKKVYDAAYENAHSQYKVKDTNYKHSLEQPAPVIVPAAESSDDSDSDSDDSDSDDDTPPAPVITPAPKPKAAPAPPPAPVTVVSTPAANTSVKKEKKKRKTEEAEVAAALHAVGVPTPEAEKKKRKKKDAAA
ncbi:high mobility group box domain-containing protein [Naematelia encephala]|uniref:High mobility group box domain-containing protein n=1 Tax=Naematelia encephala TaxID=71784 RepID=A0A1Y2BL03_9TREE|nr:high mobility group box domain-containing protein [Naematelia encephala]